MFASIFKKRRLSLSVVVVCYRMQHQIGNTLRSLTLPYQQHLRESDFEVLLVDNGSPEPLPAETWNIAGNIRYDYLPPEQANHCPARALNQAVARARAEVVCVMIDGARMVTPAALHWGLRLARMSSRAVVDVRGWHLGPKKQQVSVMEGYSHDVECQLLKEIGWPAHGYRLFEIGTPAKTGFFNQVRESNCVFMPRELFKTLGGYDERYREPGGGFVNHDFFWRAATAAQIVFTVLGEGTFHQIHGGAATGLIGEARAPALQRWQAEYERLSRPWRGEFPPYEPILVGHIPRECSRWLQPSAA